MVNQVFFFFNKYSITYLHIHYSINELVFVKKSTLVSPESKKWFLENVCKPVITKKKNFCLQLGKKHYVDKGQD